MLSIIKNPWLWSTSRDTRRRPMGVSPYAYILVPRVRPSLPTDDDVDGWVHVCSRDDDADDDGTVDGPPASR